MRGVPFEFGSKSQLMINLKFVSLSFSSNPNPNSKLGLGQSIKVIFPSFLCYFSCLIHRVSNPYAFLCFSLLLLCVCFCFIFIFLSCFYRYSNAIGDGSKLPWRANNVYMFVFDIYTHISLCGYMFEIDIYIEPNICRGIHVQPCMSSLIYCMALLCP